VQSAGELPGYFQLSSVADAGGGAYFDESSGSAFGDVEGDAARAAHEDHGMMRAEDNDWRAVGRGAKVLSVEFDFAFGQSCRGHDFFDMGFRCHLFPVGLDARTGHFSSQ
jgi:hypothetical protein